MFLNPFVYSKQVVKTKKGKGQKNNVEVEVEVSDDKLVTVKSKRNNQSNGDEKQSTSKFINNK